jgi:hypothetical protein
MSVATVPQPGSAPLVGAQIDHDGALLAVSDSSGKAYLIDTRTTARVSQFSYHYIAPGTDHLPDVPVITQDGKWVIITSPDKSMSVRDAVIGFDLTPHNASWAKQTSLISSPDSGLIATTAEKKAPGTMDCGADPRSATSSTCSSPVALTPTRRPSAQMTRT